MTKLNFRQAAIEHVSNPEQLDRVLAVTRPAGWIAIATLGSIAAIVVAWSVVGQVSTYVKAPGIFLNQGGKIVDAVSSSNGTLTAVFAAVGDTVEQGQLIGELVNPDTQERHTSALILAEERREALQILREAIAEEDALIEQNVERQTTRLRHLVELAAEQVELARKRLKDREALYEQNMITAATLDQSRSNANQAEQELVRVQHQLDELTAAEVKRGNSNTDRLVAAEEQLVQAERRVSELAALLDNERILAPASGRLTEIKATIGTVLGPGQSLASIETGVSELQALIYLPPNDGKRVEVGMEVLVSPSTARHEEYGYVKGKIESVSRFPASFDGMVATLQNDSLARSILEEGTPYAGWVTLIPDPETESGFAWTSAKGADKTLTSGTMLAAEVRVDRQAPITLVVPLLKETFNL